jgi:hypothetical protein
MCCSAVGGQQSAESPPQSLIALLVPLIGWVPKCPTPRWDRCPKISQAIHSVLRNLVEGVERRGIEIAISVQSEREELRKQHADPDRVFAKRREKQLRCWQRVGRRQRLCLPRASGSRGQVSFADFGAEFRNSTLSQAISVLLRLCPVLNGNCFQQVTL